jgi:hypothetical protein
MMWRTRREFLRSCISLFMLVACLAVCSMIVASSWPDKERSRVARSPSETPVAVVSFKSMQDLEIVPAVYQTAIAQPAELRR